MIVQESTLLLLVQEVQQFHKMFANPYVGMDSEYQQKFVMMGINLIIKDVWMIVLGEYQVGIAMEDRI